MESFNQTPRFCFNVNPHTIVDAEGDLEFSGLLEIFVHHARNIHNICIYDNQDVYAKFSLTYNPDEMISTRVIHGGGKNPEFNEKLVIKVAQLDSVLKCEIWMLSRARILLEDQLLGFALVPISMLAGKGEVTQDFSLSSTDLLHSPAGTVRLSLWLNTDFLPNSSLVPYSSISSEVVLLDRKSAEEVIVDPVEYSSIEFPDNGVLNQNQQMVSEYFSLATHWSGPRHNLIGQASFLRLGALQPGENYNEMIMNSSEENVEESVSPNGSIQTSSGVMSSTSTSMSDDHSTADSTDRKTAVTVANLQNPSGSSPNAATSEKEAQVAKDGKESTSSNDDEKDADRTACSLRFSQVFPAPLDMNVDAEQSAMQQHIMDMYTKSMREFTESLAKMKLPMDLDKPDAQEEGNVIQNQNISKLEIDKKDGSRVFYGSRAFF
ncbi:hypothetical protein Ancab_000189 [Ancistrocladus abbreviatus]